MELSKYVSIIIQSLNMPLASYKKIPHMISDIITFMTAYVSRHGNCISCKLHKYSPEHIHNSSTGGRNLSLAPHTQPSENGSISNH